MMRDPIRSAQPDVKPVPNRTRHTRLEWWVMAPILLLLLGCNGLGNLAGMLQAAATPSPTPTMTPVPTATPQPAALNEIPLLDALGRDIAERRVIDAYERVSPSVVSITTRVLRQTFFFNVVPEEGSGSGFVLDEAGHILTNFHVVQGAESIEVGFGEDQLFPAKVVGLDARNDVAVLKVDAPPELMIPVTFGDSDQLQVGQRAVAIGNPFGQFSRTLTTGVISALDRTLEGRDGRPISGVIQTDAAINRGNSGGPLLDSSGRVIGVNTAIFSPTGTSAGVGFAVPSNTVLRILPDLLELGRYRHPYLGIRYAYRVSPGLADSLSLPVEEGLLLVQLYRNSPLDNAGVQGAQREAILGNRRIFIDGDILTAVDGRPIRTVEDLQLLLESRYRVGDTVTLTLYRGENPFELELTLSEEPQ
jgi:S1-C subfamily serine protease